jgi:hypothetical protein
MNRFHKLPIKERKRQAEYNFDQTEKQWKQEEKRMMKEFERLKNSASPACRELTDKERQEQEVVKRLMQIAEMTEGNNA